MLAITITEGLAIVVLGMLVVGLLRSHADILRALHELGAGDPDEAGSSRARSATLAATPRGTGDAGHDLDGETLTGESVAISVTEATQDTLLAFLSASCYTCQPFWNELSGPADIPNGARVIAVVQAGDNLAKLRSLAGPDLLVVISDTAWTDYQVPGSPHFVYLDGPSGAVVGEGTASTWPQVRDLLTHAAPGRSSGPAPDSVIELSGHDNAERIDRELLGAGIGPGHPSLYPGSDDIEASPTEP
ncbi:MAG TPA: hypothetical protein VHV79_01890 [Mycobacteriales bacterium]|jgi:hypothetical protein|nr:hypothetical protein [Mycobacteriales bacterium]